MTYESTIRDARRTIDEHFQRIIDAATAARSSMMDMLDTNTNTNITHCHAHLDKKVVATIELATERVVTAIDGSCRVVHWHRVADPPTVDVAPVAVTSCIEQRIDAVRGRHWVATSECAAGTLLYTESPAVMSEPYISTTTIPLDIRRQVASALLSCDDGELSRSGLYSGPLWIPSNGDVQSESTDPAFTTPPSGIPVEQWLRAGLQIKGNAFGVTHMDGTQRLAIFRHISSINHSCWPNAEKVDTADGVAQIMAIRPIAAGEEILIAYQIELVRQPQHHRSILHFQCICDRCISESKQPSPSTSTSTSTSWPSSSLLEPSLTPDQQSTLRDMLDMCTSIESGVDHINDAGYDDGDNVRPRWLRLAARLNDWLIINGGAKIATHWQVQPLLLATLAALAETPPDNDATDDKMAMIPITRITSPRPNDDEWKVSADSISEHDLVASLIPLMVNAARSTLPQYTTALLDVVRIAQHWPHAASTVFAGEQEWIDKLESLFGE